jgi:hypothetical protein
VQKFQDGEAFSVRQRIWVQVPTDSFGKKAVSLGGRAVSNAGLGRIACLDVRAEGKGTGGGAVNRVSVGGRFWTMTQEGGLLETPESLDDQMLTFEVDETGRSVEPGQSTGQAIRRFCASYFSSSSHTAIVARWMFEVCKP